MIYYIAFHIICSIPTVGILLARSIDSLPVGTDLFYLRQDRIIFWGFGLLLGPFALLIALILTKGAKYGLQWR